MEMVLTTLTTFHDTWGKLTDPRIAPDHQLEMLKNQWKFAQEHNDALDRSCLQGHFTGSAFVVTENMDRVLLTHHKKLDKWLQLGGHADGEPLLHRVAFQEAIEESGLKDVRFVPYEQDVFACNPKAPIPFDLDNHVIPERKGEPQHIHFDVRFLLFADNPDGIAISDESNDLKWFSLDEGVEQNSEPSMVRQFQKLRWLKEQLSKC